MQSLICTVGLASLLLGQAGEAPVELKTRAPKAGDVTKVSSTNSFELKIHVVEAGETADQTRKSTEAMQYTQTILSVDAQARPTKLRRKYSEAKITFNDEEQTLPFHGRTVIIEKVADKWSFKLDDGKELAEADTDVLQFEFNAKDVQEDPEKLLRPGRAVRVNDGWYVDAVALGRNYEMTLPVPLDSKNAQATGKLLKSYQKNGQRFATFSVSASIPLKPSQQGKFKLSEESSLTIKQVIDGCADGSSSAGTQTSEMTLKMQGDDGPAKITMQGKGAMRMVCEDVPVRR